MTVHLFFEFHARSEDNERGIASGHNDPDLSPRGEEEAREMRGRYAERTVAAVHSSDLLRARRTAEIAFGERGIPIIHDKRLRECDYGEWNGAPVPQVHGSRPEHADVPYPGGESFRDAAHRVREVLADIKRDHDGSNVVIVGHSAIYFALEHLLKGRDLQALLAEPWVWMPVWSWEADF